MQLQYFKAAEVQERGALHFHVFIRVPRSRSLALSLGRLRELAMHYGFGHEVDLAVVDDERKSWYLAKYVSKSCSDKASMPWLDNASGEIVSGHNRYRCWTASRRWGWTMVRIREMQAEWMAQRAGSEPAQPAQAGPLDSNGHCYASTTRAPTTGGGH